MAKMFLNSKEAAQKLGKTEEDLKMLVREGKLREFRDAGSVNYKSEDIEKLAKTARGGGSGKPAPTPSGGSQSGEIVLERADDSAIELVGSGSDVLSLEEVDASERTSAGIKPGQKAAKEGSVVPSVGVNVFDDDEIDASVDPLAQTAVTDVAGLGLEGGSGSGILNLSRESDDTSLGAELLDEIYSAEEGGSAVEMGEATRAGLEEAITEPAESGEDVDEPYPTEEEEITKTRVIRAGVQVYEAAPDAVSMSLMALMIVTLVVLLVAGLGAASLVRGVVPGLLSSIYDRLLIFTGAALGVGAVAAGITYLLAKKRS